MSIVFKNHNLDLIHTILFKFIKLQGGIFFYENLYRFEELRAGIATIIFVPIPGTDSLTQVPLQFIARCNIVSLPLFVGVVALSKPFPLSLIVIIIFC